MKGQKNSLKHCPFLFIRIEYSKIEGPVRSFTVKENHIGLAVSEILRYRQKKLTALYNRITQINEL